MPTPLQHFLSLYLSYPGQVTKEDGVLAVGFPGVDAEEAVGEGPSLGGLVRVYACLDHLGLLFGIEACRARI